MKAILQRGYGGPEVLQLADIERPAVADGDVLVRVRAASANPLDWHFMRGEPLIMRMSSGLRKPKQESVGVDFAGTVEAVGSSVTRFKPGDEVFGGKTGAFAEYVSVLETKAIALKPDNVTFEEAAAVPVAATTALQALRDRGQVRQGQSVLINGASGGVGTFAVQIAKSLGAKVTAVCSTRNVDLVREIGADEVIDYANQDFTRSDQRYDLILDIAGGHTWSEYKRVLHPKSCFVVVGGPSSNRWLGPLSHSASLGLASMRAAQKVVPFFLAQLTPDDLAVLQGLMASGQVKPVIDRTYSLIETPEAIRYLEAGHARGKVVITV
ncbi:MAG TPA: NAD(P)-dependent alcohol dehydrogenase [Candidatus Acidoferrum sp.]|jgi:NADPH:quinone reductase-like Zn-dependent oxidoreductase|nr:NAD(P)-dependent alcohol dehydrogenase [Candidatus Acidoferrum sp.]